MDDAARGANAIVTVDLEKQEIAGPDGGTIAFDIDPFRKHCLVNGLDDIGLTLQKADRIAVFEKARSEEHTSELQSLMRISYAVFCLKKKNNKSDQTKNICVSHVTEVHKTNKR